MGTELDDYRKRVESYDEEELSEILRSLDKERYPERHEIVLAELGRRRDLPPGAIPAPLPPSGIGGWLILPLIGLCLSPLFALYGLIAGLQVLGNTRVIAVLTDPESPVYFPYYIALFSVESTYNLALLVFSIWVLVCFLRKRQGAPRLYIAMLLISFGFQWTEYAFVRAVASPDAHPDVDTAILKAAARATVAAAIWVPYFLRSERVKNTFVN